MADGLMNPLHERRAIVKVDAVQFVDLTGVMLNPRSGGVTAGWWSEMTKTHAVQFVRNGRGVSSIYLGVEPWKTADEEPTVNENGRAHLEILNR